MDVLNCEKKSEKVYHCNDMAQVISKICDISRKQTFALKKEAAPAGDPQLC